MRILSITGSETNTSSEQQRINKSIGALAFKIQGLENGITSLKDELITIYIERSNGDNEYIANSINLKAFICNSVFGDGQINIDSDKVITVLTELSEHGSIDLEEDETIILKLDKLQNAVTYIINGLPYPVFTDSVVKFEEKVLLQGQKSKTYDVTMYDQGFIDGDFTKVNLTYDTEDGYSTVEYSKDELRIISADIGLTQSGTSVQIPQTLVSLIGVTKLEIHATNQVNITLRDVDEIEELQQLEETEQ